MLRDVVFASFLLAAVTGSAFAVDKLSSESNVVHAGGLMCFSIRPLDSPTKPETKHSPALYRSCDELCAAKGAACTATTSNHNPPVSCDGSDYRPEATLCRCCAFGH